MEDDARILLDDAIEFCKRDGIDTRVINMLTQSRAVELTDDALTIEAPSRFAYTHLVKQRVMIERYLEEIAFAPLRLTCLAPRGAETTEPTGGSAAPLNAYPTRVPQHTQTPDPVLETSKDAASQVQHSLANPFVSSQNKEPRSVTVNNTMTPETFQRMMASMKGEVQTPAKETISEASEPDRDFPAVSVNAKFTFENFVFGDENKHAYQSAVRFAAFADDPGQCTSLFIYGNSGLGKTHLLLAIMNYLAGEKPYIRVKYANSQAYLDDYMRELGSRRGPGELIMREYRSADVLIIDDIQNIVGKQASVEFFFQLVDEFIREQKKIVIASDRQPKKLGMDERLTSRFNSGMLCLVSEPGFEMKYAILKNYYENTIRGGALKTPSGGDISLLCGMNLESGTLTDAHLRHMAEISGTNIRELESFCERCAGLSSEREAVGRELSAEDIDAVADEYFDTAHKVVRVDTVQAVVEEFYHVSHEDMVGSKRQKGIAFPRHVAVYLANSLCEMSLKAVGGAFGRTHTTVIHSLEVVESRMKEDMRFREEIEQLKDIILLKS